MQTILLHGERCAKIERVSGTGPRAVEYVAGMVQQVVRRNECGSVGQTTGFEDAGDRQAASFANGDPF